MKRKLSLILSSIAILGGVGITAPLIVSCSKETLPEKPTNVIMFSNIDTKNLNATFGFMEEKNWKTLEYSYEHITISSKYQDGKDFIEKNNNISHYFELQVIGTNANNSGIAFDEKTKNVIKNKLNEFNYSISYYFVSKNYYREFYQYTKN